VGTVEAPVNIEAVLASHIARRAVVVGPILVAIFWITRGAEGALAAAFGVVLVVANFLLAGAMLSVAAKISPALYQATALLGFFLRFGLMTLTVILVLRLTDLDRLAFGLAAVAAYIVLLAWETVAVSRGAEKELEWTQ
jgi:predicted Na+-dependent transporter